MGATAALRRRGTLTPTLTLTLTLTLILTLTLRRRGTDGVTDLEGEDSETK